VAATLTTIKKKRRDAVEMGKLIGSTDILADVAQGTCNEVQVSTQSWGEISSVDLGFQSGVQPIPLP
jgi:hypothetical protein